MARLEIEIGIGGISNVNKGITDVNGALSKLQSQYDKTMKEVAKASQTSRELEGELLRLNNAYKSGSISEKEFNRETRAIQSSLSSARQALGQYQSQAKSLSATINQSTLSVANQGREIKKLEGYHKSFNSGIRSTNTLAVEFSRVVQDAPYGLQGMANNIQQLTQNFANYAKSAREAAAAQGTTLSTGNLLRGALMSFANPLNLLTLGISAVTAGLVAYEKWSQKSAKASEEAAKKKDELVKSLGSLSTAMYNAESSSGAEIAKLQTLYRVATDVNTPMQARLKAVRDLKKEYPSYLNSFSNEAIMAGNAKKAYDELTASIIATARARAAESLIGEKSSQQFAIDEANKDLEKQIKLQEKDLKQKREISSLSQSTTGFSPTNVVTDTDELRSQGKLRDLQKQVTDNLLNRAKLQEQINELSDVAVKNQSTLTKDVKEQTTSTKTLVDYVSKLNEIEQKSLFSSTLSEQDSGLDSQIEKIKQKYVKLEQEVDKVEKQGLANTKSNANSRTQIINAALEARKQIEVSRGLEILEATKNFEERTNEAISSILEKANVSRINSRNQDLQANELYYNNLENTYKNNAKVLEAITEARKASEFQINEKWNQKALDSTQKIYDKIRKIEEKEVSKSKSNDALESDMKERLKQIEDYYKAIIETLKINNLPINEAIKEMYDSFQKVYDSFKGKDNDAKKQSDKLSKVVERGFRQGLDSIFSEIDNLGSNFYEVFNNVFGKLSGSVTKIFTDVLSTQIGSLMSKSWDSETFNIAGLKSGVSKAIIAGAGLAGQAMGSVFKATNQTGQALAGGLSGAASGFAIGSSIGGIGGPIGAIAGGLIGALSGVFGAKARKKQEEIAQQQLEEQKKQTELQKRMAALSYSSNIVGQMSNQGIVQGVDRNEFGDIEFRIEGRDIVGSYDREKKAQERGL